MRSLQSQIYSINHMLIGVHLSLVIYLQTINPDLARSVSRIVLQGIASYRLKFNKPLYKKYRDASSANANDDQHDRNCPCKTLSF